MLTDAQIRAFQNDGFLNYGPVLSLAELDDLRASLARVMESKGEAKPDLMRNIGGRGGDNSVVVQIVNIWEVEPAFRRHLYHEKIVPLAAQLMNADTVRVWHDQVQIKPARIGGPTIWHQDHPYWPIIQPADLVSAWVAPKDATPANGCMSMVRGSHHWGAYPGGTIGSDLQTYGPAHDLAFPPAGAAVEVVPLPVRAGGVVFHHCLTWHGAPPNRSADPRPAIAVHYMPGWTRYQPQGRTHVVEKHIEVAPGAPLAGAHFPTVYENGHLQAA